MAPSDGSSGSSGAGAAAGNSTGRIVGVGIILILLLIGAYFAVQPGDDAEAPVEVAQPEAEGAPEAEPDVAEADEPVVEEPAEPEVAEAEETATEPTPEPAPIVPTFDVVRVEPDGRTLVAGSGEPGATISIMVDGEEVGTAEADSSGKFVAMLKIDAADTARAMSMSSTGENGEAVASAQSVIVAPAPIVEEPVEVAEAPADETDEAVEVAQAPEADVEETTEVVSNESSGEDTQVPANTNMAGTTEVTDNAPEVVADAPPVPGDAEQAEGSFEEKVATVTEGDTPDVEQPAAPTVLLADEKGIEVLQSAGPSPEALQNIVVDTITYDSEGDVVLAGRGTAEDRSVRVYIDNQPVQELPVDADGGWRAPLPDVDTGVYTLRIDEIDAEGRVVSRIETPFKREAREDIKALEAQARLSPAPLQILTVQEGNTLWGLSQGALGDGRLYVKLFEANKERITDPDLIYPGQIFAVPN